MDIAAIKAEPAPMGVKVKPLEWRDSFGVMRADTPFGTYSFTEGRNTCLLKLGVAPLNPVSPCATPEAAREFAQKHYQTHILSATEPTPITSEQAARVLLEKRNIDEFYNAACIGAKACDRSLAEFGPAFEAAIRDIAGEGE